MIVTFFCCRSWWACEKEEKNRKNRNYSNSSNFFVSWLLYTFFRLAMSTKINGLFQLQNTPKLREEELIQFQQYTSITHKKNEKYGTLIKFPRKPQCHLPQVQWIKCSVFVKCQKVNRQLPSLEVNGTAVTKMKRWQLIQLFYDMKFVYFLQEKHQLNGNGKKIRQRANIDKLSLSLCTERKTDTVCDMNRTT